MKSLLYLVHRIPYPPNKGDKIRSYHLLKRLTETYRVFLGAFVDDPADWEYTKVLSNLCADVYLRPLNPLQAKFRCLAGLVSRQALTLSYYRDAAMQSWVDGVIDSEGIDQVVIFSSAMAQYVEGNAYRDIYRLVDYVDMDSAKWSQYSQTKPWPNSWLYRREGRLLLDYELKIASTFDACFFVSQAERDYFTQYFPSSSGNIYYYNNGVDTDYFNPSREYANPYQHYKKIIVFTGAMDYWANIDAVCWFAHKIFPSIRKQLGDVYFYIVGSNPAQEVCRLENEGNIKVTGKVPDVRPYLAHAALAIAPMRIARGVQNKVLEALAMNCPIIATDSAVQGIAVERGRGLLVLDSEQEMVIGISRFLTGDTGIFSSTSGRACVLDKYNWDFNVGVLAEHLKNTSKHSNGM